ncbi:uncharacterized protein LOC132717308 [Ruditapes philippinarum]|uniref:uncharacterized protein LOC132717308 n=1 Tax=Ruditapes philippinarum TaxID=129788 RepID=UPI00295BFFA2|nr:uncharacterized protein LOC132717308 [Ruditapes philippinarum]
METPNIIFQGKDEELPVTVDNDVLGMLGNEAAWVGYYLAAAYFHYIGCLKMKGMSVNAEFDHNTPGLCYSACMKKGPIGISGKKCYCLNNTDQLEVCSKECNKDCKDDDDIACGAKECMSVYSFEPAAKLYSGDENCLLYEAKNEGPDLTWSDCTKSQGVICSLKDTVQNALDKGKIQEKGGWRESMNICFKLRMLPPSIEQLKDFNLSTPSWVGVIKSDVIYSIEDGPITHTWKEFGYLKKKGDGAVLIFDDDIDTSQKQILCKTAIKTTPSRRSTSSSTTMNHSKYSSTATTKSQGSTKLNSTPSSTPKDSTISLPRKSSDVGVPVGISIGVFLIVVIAVIIAVLLFKKRAMLPVTCCWKFTSDKTEKRTLGLVNNIAYEIPVNSPYDEIDEDALQQNNDTAFNSSEDNRDDAHTYFVLEKDAEEPKTDSGITGSKAYQNENNVYNTLRSNLEPGPNIGDTYDTAEKAAKRMKDQDVEKCSTNGDMDEDAYNHINAERIKKGKTDNVYGVQGDIDSDYGDAKHVREQGQNVEDTYNHINPEH